MQTCPECGNHDMRVRLVAGASVHECGLCGARFGPRDVLGALDDGDEARHRGVEAGIWPLVRALDRLPGLVVRATGAADASARTLPFVALALASPAGLVQLENLAKSLRLGAGTLQRPWVMEVEFQQQLTIVLKPRHPGGAIAAAELREAGQDVVRLGRMLERDSGLSWWRSVGSASP